MSRKTENKSAMKETASSKKAETEKAAATSETEATKEGTETKTPDETAPAPGVPNTDKERPNPSAAQAGTTLAGTEPTAGDLAEARVVQNVAENAESENAPEMTEKDLAKDSSVVGKLVDELIDDVLSFSGPVRGSLRNKPRVSESWDKTVNKARLLQKHRETVLNKGKKAAK